jgi:hypothetical protein
MEETREVTVAVRIQKVMLRTLAKDPSILMILTVLQTTLIQQRKKKSLLKSILTRKRTLQERFLKI